jgi:hypothetical protein
VLCLELSTLAYAAWQRLKQILEHVLGLEERVAERYSWIEIAKKHCMAGIRRAESIRGRRHTPYYKALVVLAFLALCRVPLSHAQTIERYEGVLIDTSASISRDGANGDLFQQYLRSTKKLLAHEPPNSRVWVSSIARDSFGGVRDIVTGWTPDARGIFTDDLNRARRQLMTRFEAKSAELAPTATGTDIFGGLWHVKAIVDSAPSSRGGSTKNIYIFSDMMNETAEFPMPRLLEIGPENMLERAKTTSLLVPLHGYSIYIYGASTNGLTAHSWETVRRFWELYFAAAGATLVTYSTQCEIGR